MVYFQVGETGQSQSWEGALARKESLPALSVTQENSASGSRTLGNTPELTRATGQLVTQPWLCCFVQFALVTWI